MLCCLNATQSIWSIGTTFKLSNLPIVMLLVAVATYSVVCNLNRLVQSGGGAYKVVKAGVIRRMKEEEKEHWHSRAARFDRFEPQREDNKPTEWYILMAALTFLFRDTLAMVKRPKACSSNGFPSLRRIFKRSKMQQCCGNDSPSLLAEDSASTFKVLNEKGTNDRSEQSVQKDPGNDMDQISEIHSSPPPIDPVPMNRNVTRDAAVLRPSSPQSARSKSTQSTGSKPTMSWLRKRLVRLKKRKQVTKAKGVQEDV